MKKVLGLFVVVLCLSLTVQAQDGKQSVIKINPLGAFFGAAQLSYEHALGEHSSFLVSPSLGFFKSGDFKYNTYGLGAEYRFYLSNGRTAPAGFYVSPGLGYSFGTAKESFDGETDKTNVSGLTGKAVFGHQWIWSSGFSLDLNGGIQYFGLKFKDNDTFGSATAFSGILPALGFGIGYAF